MLMFNYKFLVKVRKRTFTLQVLSMSVVDNALVMVNEDFVSAK